MSVEGLSLLNGGIIFKYLIWEFLD